MSTDAAPRNDGAPVEIDHSILENVGTAPLDDSNPALWACRPGDPPWRPLREAAGIGLHIYDDGLQLDDLSDAVQLQAAAMHCGVEVHSDPRVPIVL